MSVTVIGCRPTGTRGSYPPYDRSHTTGISVKGWGASNSTLPPGVQVTARSPKTLIVLTCRPTVTRMRVEDTALPPGPKALPRTATSVCTFVGQKTLHGAHRGVVSGDRMS